MNAPAPLRIHALGVTLTVLIILLIPSLADGRAIRVDRGIESWDGSVLANDGFVEIPIESRMETEMGRVPVPFSINFFGETYTSLFANENGVISFGNPFSGTRSDTDFANSLTPMIAPFFADADMSGLSVAVGTGFTDILGGPNLFINFTSTYQGATGTEVLNRAQVVLVDRSGLTGTVGDFKLEINFDTVEWETGDSDGGTNGFGGMAGITGFTNGFGTSYQVAGSGMSGALLKPDFFPPDGFCIANPLSVGCNDYFYEFRGGVPYVDGVPIIGVVSEPPAWALLAVGLLAFASLGRGQRKFLPRRCSSKRP